MSAASAASAASALGMRVNQFTNIPLQNCTSLPRERNALPIKYITLYELAPASESIHQYSGKESYELALGAKTHLQSVKLLDLVFKKVH